MPNKQKTTNTAPLKPGEITEFMKHNNNALADTPTVLLSGFYKGRPCVHLAFVYKDGDDYLVAPFARMYDESDMAYIGDPDNKQTELQNATQE